MDEPLGALDRQLREAMQYEMRRIHRSLGVTFIYVTHDQNEALTMSDRIAVINNGKVQQLASPSDLYEKPATAFVARFIGENNRLHGRVQRIEKDVCIVEVGGSLIRAAAGNVATPGSDTMLSVRPERVVVNPTSADVVNTFESVVQELIYVGDHIRMRLALCGVDDFIVKIPNTAAAAVKAVGQRLVVGWRIVDCRALDPS
jgi:putative spermidine/putrescine transport system ATP-binding protein